MILNLILFFSVLTVGLVIMTVVLQGFGIETIPVGKTSIKIRIDTGLQGERFTIRMGLKAIAWGVWVLCAIYLLSLIYCAVSRDNISWEDFCCIWSRADAVHYQKLAELGYHDYIEDGQRLFLVFFPLYPWLVRLVHFAIADYNLCGHLVSAVSYIFGCYMLARLITEEFGWRTCKRSLLLFSAYPFAFLFAGMFTESLFFLLSVTTFYFIRKHRYLWAGIVGALAALTRMQGVMLIIAGGIEFCLSTHPFEKIKARDFRSLWHDIWTKLLPLALILTGTCVYLWLNYAVEGNLFQFSYYQREHWYQYMVPMWTIISTIWSRIFTTSTTLLFTTWLPDLLVFAAALFVLAYSVRSMPVTWTVYYLICLLLNYSLSWPLSCGRYMACAFPMAVSLAAANRRHPAAENLLALGMAVLQGGYAYAFLSGTALW